MTLLAAPSQTQTHNPWLSHVAVVESIQSEIDSVATFHLRLTDAKAAAQYRFQPGQFNMLYLPSCGESAISLSGAPTYDGTELIHTIRFVGRVTHAMARLRVGDQIGVRGPFGTAWPLVSCHGNDVVILSGGIGLAPLRPAIYHILANRSQFGRVVLLHGARTPDLLLYAGQLDAWSNQGIEVQTTVDRADSQWQGTVGVVPLLLDRLSDLRSDKTQVITCGPEVMMHYSALSALKRGIPEQAIWLSIERNMQCAVGLCGHCQVGAVFVCRDGPVFRYDKIKHLLRVRDF